MGWMGLWGFVGIALIVLVVWALMRTGGGQRGNGESPEQILKRRNARGEIDRATYERMMQDLKT